MLHVTGSHVGTICMQLATTRVQFICDWQPPGYNFYMRLSASLMQILQSCVQSRQFFASTLQEQLFEVKMKTPIKI
jgi:hypothetical protein